MNPVYFFFILFIPRCFVSEYTEEASVLLGVVLCVIGFYSNKLKFSPIHSAPIIALMGWCAFRISPTFFSDRYVLLMGFAILGYLMALQEKPKVNGMPLLIFVSLVYVVGYMDLIKWNPIYQGADYVNSKFYNLKSIFNQKNEFQFWNLLFLTYSYYFKEEFNTRAQKVLLQFLQIIGLLFLAVGMAKAALLAFLGVVFVMAFKNKKTQKVVLLVLVMILVFVILRWDDILRTIQLRVYIYESSWNLFLDNFLFGVGAGGYPYVIQEYFVNPININLNAIFVTPHNMILYVLSELGIVGGFLCVFITGLVIKNIGRMEGTKKQFSLIMIVMIFVQGSLGQPLMYAFLPVTALFYFLGFTLNYMPSKPRYLNNILYLVPLFVIIPYGYSYINENRISQRFLNSHMHWIVNNGNIRSGDMSEYHQMSPNNPIFHYWQFVMDAHNKPLDEVKKSHSRLVNSSRSYFDWHYDLAFAFARHGLFEACIQNLDVLLRKNPYENHLALNLKSHCLYYLDCFKWKEWNEKSLIYFEDEPYWKGKYYRKTTCSESGIHSED